MKARREWAVEFYTDAKGRQPVRQWLQSLQEETRARVAAHINLLATEGPTLDYPYTSQIEGKLRELRVQISGTNHRILYFFDPERTCILLHAFVKTTAAVPVADKKLGMDRMEDHATRRNKPVRTKDGRKNEKD